MTWNPHWLVTDISFLFINKVKLSIAFCGKHTHCAVRSTRTREALWMLSILGVILRLNIAHTCSVGFWSGYYVYYGKTPIPPLTIQLVSIRLLCGRALSCIRSILSTPYQYFIILCVYFKSILMSKMFHIFRSFRLRHSCSSRVRMKSALTLNLIVSW